MSASGYSLPPPPHKITTKSDAMPTAIVYKENANFYIQFEGEEYGTLCNILEQKTGNGYDSYHGYRISNIEEGVMTILPPDKTFQLVAPEQYYLEEFKHAVDKWNNATMDG